MENFKNKINIYKIIKSSQADRLAAGLRELGLKTGDHVGLWAPNTTNWYISMMALARGGFVTVGLNPAYQVPEVEYCLRKIKIKAVITIENYRSQMYYDMLNEIVGGLESHRPNRIACDSLPNLKIIIVDSYKKLPYEDIFYLV